MDHPARLKLFDAIRAEQGSFLEATLWRLTGNRELFVEALQEALVQVWRHLEQLQGPAGRSYLYRIAQSAAGKAWRQRAGCGTGELEDRQGPVDRPDDRALRSEESAAMRRAICELPDKQGLAITMRYLEQKDYAVIARETGCEEATLRSHVSKALATLRARLTEDRVRTGR
jgi:RNA polymerase sigma factor (sigma-70 family)